MKTKVVGKRGNRLISFLMLFVVMFSLMGTGSYADSGSIDVPMGDAPEFIMITVKKNGEPYVNASLTLSKYGEGGAAPNVVERNIKTDKYGMCALYGPMGRYQSFDPNSKYEIRIAEGKTLSFPIDHIIFDTDANGKVSKIYSDNLEFASGFITFEGSGKNSGSLKVQEVVFKVVDKDNKPVEGVPLTANIITPLASFQTMESDKEGNVTFKLEGRGIFTGNLDKEKINSKIYSVTVSKNGQFMWEFEPEEVTIYVFENKVFSEKNVPLQITVTKNDQTDLLEELKKVILEAKDYLASHEFANEKAVNKLKEIVHAAEDELSKETIPGYAIAFTKGIRDAMENLKKYEKPKAEQPSDKSSNLSGGTARSSVRPDHVETIKDLSPALASPEQKMVSEKAMVVLSLNDSIYRTRKEGKLIEKEMSMKPMIHKGRMMMTSEFIAELLEMEIKSDDSAKRIEFTWMSGADEMKKSNSITLDLAQNMLKVDGKEMKLSTEVLNINGKTLIPFIDIQKATKALGSKIDVKWDHQTKTLSLEEIA